MNPHMCTGSLLSYIYSNLKNKTLSLICLCLCVIHQETGFWFIFHHVPTGPSEGLYSPGHTEHIPMGQFTNNRAHSNYRVSLKMDGCQKLQYHMVYTWLALPTSDHMNKLSPKKQKSTAIIGLLLSRRHSKNTFTYSTHSS